MMILAVFGSLAIHASEKRTVAKITCYISPVGGTRCSLPVVCNNIVNPILCTAVYHANTYQVFAKSNPNDTSCEVLCYRNFN